jgi:hypothetical protein
MDDLSTMSRRALAEKLDSDLRRNFVDCSLHFLGCVGQPVGVNVYSYAASGTAHVVAGLESSNCLLEFVPASRALKFDHMSVSARHRRNSIRARASISIIARLLRRSSNISKNNDYCAFKLTFDTQCRGAESTRDDERSNCYPRTAHGKTKCFGQNSKVNK